MNALNTVRAHFIFSGNSSSYTEEHWTICAFFIINSFPDFFNNTEIVLKGVLEIIFIITEIIMKSELVT